MKSNYLQLIQQLHKTLSGSMAGDFISKYVGSGIERADQRKFTHGDSIKTINRKRSAKANELYTDVLQQDQDILIDICCDINANRRGGFDKINSDVALDIIDTICHFARQYHGHIRFMYSQDERLTISTNTLNSKERDRHIAAIRNSIIAAPRRYKSVIQDIIDTLILKKSPHMIVILSDFLDIDKYYSEQLYYLQKRHVTFIYELPIWSLQGDDYTHALGR